jgi:hypothetical protein
VVTRKCGRHHDQLRDTHALLDRPQEAAVFIVELPDGRYAVRACLGSTSRSNHAELYLQSGTVPLVQKDLKRGVQVLVDAIATVRDGKLRLRLVRSGREPPNRLSWLAIMPVDGKPLGK